MLLTVAIVKAQEGSVIAEVGNRKITDKEFKLRFEMVPQTNKNKFKDDETLKEDYLFSIIAEKLWALAAEEKGFTSTDIMKKTFKIIEKMYVRDALYEKEIKSKIKIDESNYRKAKERIGKILYLKYLVSFDENEISKLYNQLNAGSDFDSLLAGREENKLQKEFTYIEFGDVDEALENKLFSLSPGQYTDPVKNSGGWFIFKLYKIETKKFNNDREYRTALSKARGILEKRVYDKTEKEFYRKFFLNKKVNSNGYVFWSISNAVIKALKKNKIENKIPDGQKVSLEAKDYNYLVDLIGADTLQMNFIEIGSEKITTEDFVRALIFEGFYSNNLTERIIRAKLNARVKRFIEHELLAQEGYKRGYDELPDVKMNINIWRDKYLADLFKSELLAGVKVTEEEAENIYKKERGNKVKQVNIVELLTDSLDIINKVFSELSAGKELRPLAIKYTKRKWVKENNGEFGFFPVSLYGDIGRIASGMKIGEIYGPLETPDGYSIFQLIGVKEDEVEHKDFDNVKDEFIKKLKAEKIRKELINKTVELANKFGVKINEEALKALRVENLQMLVYKYFGFGGRMLAFPLTPEFTEWVVPWKNASQLP